MTKEEYITKLLELNRKKRTLENEFNYVSDSELMDRIIDQINEVELDMKALTQRYQDGIAYTLKRAQ